MVNWRESKMKKKIIIIIITIAVICGGIALAFMGGGTKDIKKGTKNKENIIIDLDDDKNDIELEIKGINNMLNTCFIFF